MQARAQTLNNPPILVAVMVDGHLNEFNRHYFLLSLTEELDGNNEGCDIFSAVLIFFVTNHYRTVQVL